MGLTGDHAKFDSLPSATGNGYATKRLSVITDEFQESVVLLDVKKNVKRDTYAYQLSLEEFNKIIEHPKDSNIFQLDGKLIVSVLVCGTVTDLAVKKDFMIYSVNDGTGVVDIFLYPEDICNKKLLDFCKKPSPKNKHFTDSDIELLEFMSSRFVSNCTNQLQVMDIDSFVKVFGKIRVFQEKFQIKAYRIQKIREVEFTDFIRKRKKCKEHKEN